MKKIIHVDMDCFYAAVEVRDNPELSGLPVAVGGLSENRGVICSANYEARKFGIRSAQSSAAAIRQCPDLRLIYPEMQKYITESKKIQAIFRKFTNLVEPLSLDEAYLDVSNSAFFQGSASMIANEIRKQIFESTGLTASAGIAPNKFLAKVASDWNKPNGQFAIPPAMIESFVKKLPVEKIWGVGKVTAQKMHDLGITICGDLQKIPQAELKNHFGSFGYSLYELCRGIDHREVITFHEPKSLSIEKTFLKDAASLDECLNIMPGLLDRFHRRSQDLSPERKKQIKTIKTFFVKIKFSDFTSTTVASTTFNSSFNSICLENFTTLLKKGIERKNMPVRLIGLGVRFKSEKSANESGKNRADMNQLLLF
jgi:DNA polymerase-4